ncbi:MAG: hypothetical protein CMJ49_05260 [Planctomycetaceae bacterium]|nr:hypothetical protein [Planctomycetaceae bacterium]
MAQRQMKPEEERSAFRLRKIRSTLRVTARHLFALLWLCIAITTSIGCGQPAGRIFPMPNPPVVWPDPPSTARVQYVGKLTNSDDLKPAVSLPQSVGRILLGDQPPHTMVTPFAICTDDRNRLFVADSNAQLIHVFDLDSRAYDQWKPAGHTVTFAQPVGIAFDPSGRIIVADSVAQELLIFDRTGSLTDRVGHGVLQRPTGVAVDPTTGRLLVADAGAHQILVFSRQGNLLRRLGEQGTELGQFNYPTHVALDPQRQLYVTDSLNFRIQHFDADLNPLRIIGRQGHLPGYFSMPKGIATDSDGHLYTIDAHFEAVQIFNRDGQLLLTFGAEGHGPAEFWLPTGIHIDVTPSRLLYQSV